MLGKEKHHDDCEAPKVPRKGIRIRVRDFNASSARNCGANQYGTKVSHWCRLCLHLRQLEQKSSDPSTCKESEGPCYNWKGVKTVGDLC